MAITTIQIHEEVKNELEKLKEKKQTYEEIIIQMIKTIETQKRKQKELLVQGYKEMAKESLKITKEFEHADAEIDWEY